MLQQMRRLPKWVAFVLLLPLSATFVVWGIADIFKGSVDTSLATVGGTKIDSQTFTRDFNNARRAVTQRSGGGQLSAARAADIGHKLLEQTISDTALDNTAHGFNLSTSNDEVAQMIRSLPGFQGPDGSFSQIAFNQALDRIGYTPDAFVAEIKREMTREQLVRAGSSATQLPQGYIRAIASYLNERRAVQYMIVPSDAAGPIAQPTDQQLEAFIKAHANDFSTPEFRQLTYAVLGPDDVASGVQVTDAQLHQAYDLNKDSYVVPERRDVERITFKDEASAKAARAKIDAGTKFEDIAAEQHVAPADLKLGSLAQADLGPVQGPAAFALPVGGITQPVKYTFGWSLLRVTGITPGKTTTFDQAAPELKTKILKQLAGSKLEDVINAYDDAHNAGAEMPDAAKKVGMKVVRVAATDARGLAQDGSKADVPTTPDFLDQVFKADVGTETDPFKSSDGHYYIVKVEGVIPQKLKPLDTVRAQALAAWTDQQRVKQLAAKAEEIAKRANAGEDLAQIANQYHAVLASSPALVRDQPTPVMSTSFLKKIFSVPGGKTVSGTAADGKSFIVARVTGIFHPPLIPGDPQLVAFEQELDRQLSNDMQENMGKAARAAQSVTINQPQVDRVLGGEGS